MVVMNQNVVTPILRFGKWLLMLVFIISYRQWLLYMSDQNSYYLHGLADSGMGFLKSQLYLFPIL